MEFNWMRLSGRVFFCTLCVKNIIDAKMCCNIASTVQIVLLLQLNLSKKLKREINVDAATEEQRKKQIEKLKKFKPVVDVQLTWCMMPSQRAHFLTVPWPVLLLRWRCP